MTLEWVMILVAAGESETVECKARKETRREAAATVCAMLNQGSGHVLGGVGRSPGGDIDRPAALRADSG